MRLDELAPVVDTAGAATGDQEPVAGPGQPPEQAREIFRRAIERGEIPPDTKIEVAVDMVYGPLYHRLLHGHAPLGEQFVRDVVDTALGGIIRDPAGQP